MKKFNLTGVCIPQKHYMVNTDKKLENIEVLIDEGLYFTINRARQYGKTTTISQISERLKNKYIVIDISFEGLGNESFETIENFSESFITLLADELEYNKVSKEIINNFQINKEAVDKWEILSKKISELIKDLEKEVILIIDEVDKSSNNQLFLHFLGMLRNKYLLRERKKDRTFKSVVLAGVYDVKNQKLKIRHGEEQKFNSPWNIATDFNIDMSFNPEEIATMLQDYENENHAGMDIKAISEEIHKYTSGYPYLVSRVCKTIDEELNSSWQKETLAQAAKIIVNSKSTLFDDLIKNIENNQELYELVYNMLILGNEYSFSISDPIIQMGSTFGIFENNNQKLKIHNIIFETFLYNHMSIAKERKDNKVKTYESNQFIKSDGELDIIRVLDKFKELMTVEYRSENEEFLEREGRLIFLAFIKPIINGIGDYFVEVQTRTNKRMDIVVTYNKKKYIIELKIWRGSEKEKDALKQLSDYLKIQKETKGYLVTFNFNKKNEYTAEWKNYEDKEIYAVVV